MRSYRGTNQHSRNVLFGTYLAKSPQRTMSLRHLVYQCQCHSYEPSQHIEGNTRSIITHYDVLRVRILFNTVSLHQNTQTNTNAHITTHHTTPHHTVSTPTVKGECVREAEAQQSVGRVTLRDVHSQPTTPTSLHSQGAAALTTRRQHHWITPRTSVFAVAL